MPPRFSIVVPTRNRAGTLRFALETCLAQEGDDYEVVVADNCSTPETKRVVDALGSGKLRYVRSDTALAMTDNWERAVLFATGEYVIVIGDDDGMLLHALTDIERIISQTNARLIRWERVGYQWPNTLLTAEANRLGIPINEPDCVCSGCKTIRFALNELSYTAYRRLPMLYNSVVHRELLDELRARTGRVFQSEIPDVYSGVALAYVAEKYLSVGRPMSIAGASGSSNGIASTCLQLDNPVTADFRALNAGSGLGSDKMVPDFDSWPTAMAKGILEAKRALFPKSFGLSLDRENLLRKCVQALPSGSENERVHAECALRRSVADDRSLKYFVLQQLAGAPSVKGVACSIEERERPQQIDVILVNADEFGVTDVFGAAQLCEKMLHYCERPIVWHADGWRNGKMSMTRRVRRAAGVLLRGV